MYTIGYDFGDVFIETGVLKIAARLSTEKNLYCPHSGSTVTSKQRDHLEMYTNRLSSAGGQDICDGYLKMEIKRYDDGRFGIKAEAFHPSEKCKSIVLLIKGIDVRNFVYDSENMGAIPFKDNIGIDPIIYPGRTPMMPLIFIQDDKDEWFILSKDDKVRRKAFAAHHDYISKQSIITICHEEDRRHWSNLIVLPEWHIGRSFNRIDIVRERCRDMENMFGAVPFTLKNEYEWIDNIKLVINFHGEHWTGHIFNTFDQMAEQLDWVCKLIDGNQVLAFLPAWDGRYYYTYPKHQPSVKMGGRDGLLRFIKKAHELGVKVVFMLGGPNLVTFDFLNESDLGDCALKNEWGYPLLQNWVDWNSDLSKECCGYIANFGNPDYHKYMIDSTSKLFEEYDVDGIFLDGAIRWENSPDYSPYEGMFEWVKEMKKRYPEKLIMAEDGYDVLWSLFGLFATADSPIGVENAFMRYSRQTFYLAYPAENGSGGVHERAWNWGRPDRAMKDYTIPTISLLYGDIEKYRDKIIDKVNASKNWIRRRSDIEKI